MAEDRTAFTLYSGAGRDVEVDVCRTCGGTGRLGRAACPDCQGTGRIAARGR